MIFLKMMQSWKNLKNNSNKAMKKLKLLICLFAVFLFLSCEKVIEAKDLPEQDSRIVLNSLLFSEDLITANITASRGILSNKAFKDLDKAVCQVFENDAYLGNLINIQNGNFTSFFTAKVNNKYRLIVTASGYSSVTATTIIPPSVKYTNLERYDTLNYYYRLNQYSSTKSFGGIGKFKLKVLDDLSAKNFYSIKPIVILIDSLGRIIENDGYAYIKNNNDENSYESNSFEIDDLTKVNGNQMQLDFDVSFYFNIPENLKSISVYLEISNLSQEYYNYKMTLKKQAEAGGGFFSEPVLVYSNVINGLGILGGSSLTTFRIY
jgi:hypothetical protein